MTTPENNEDEFDAAFEEFAGGAAAQDEDDVTPDVPDADDDLGDEPEDEAGEEASLEPDEDDAQAPDLAAELDRYKQESQQWQHRYNSDMGRQSALQRKITEQQQLIDQLKAAPPAKPANVSDSEWDSIKEDFPELAAAMDARLSSMTTQYEQQIQQLQGQLQPIQQQASEQYRDSQYQILEQQHPGWRELAGSTAFQTWVGDQPAAIQQLMSSESAADAAYLINSYKLVSGSNLPPKDDLRQRRQQQLRSSQSIPGRSGRKTAVAEDDFDAAFEYYANRK